jgi:hypothetical protein
MDSEASRSEHQKPIPTSSRLHAILSTVPAPLGEEETVKCVLPAETTVVRAKEEVEQELGIAMNHVCLFNADEAFEEERTSEAVGILREGKGEKALLSLMVVHADAQHVVPNLSPNPNCVLGEGAAGNDDRQLNNPKGAAFVPSHPEWLVTTECVGHRVKVSNIHTGTMVCKFGEKGSGEGQFISPWGVAVSADSSL